MPEPPRHGVLLAVEDHGIGISPADLPYVFEPFRCGSNAGAALGGTGISLGSVRQIVEQHGGTVHVASRERAGTIITVWLPVHAPAPPVEGSV